VLEELRSTPSKQNGRLNSMDDYDYTYGSNSKYSQGSHSGSSTGQGIYTKLSTKIDVID
jgi:hypothetical protein